MKRKLPVERTLEAQYDPPVIRRFYVHNFRCLENFELPVSKHRSVLLIGKNGTGKSTIGFALEMLQRIGRGTIRANELIRSKDAASGRDDVPIRFEIEVELEEKVYEYVIAFSRSRDSKELHVFEEKLSVDGQPRYSRVQANASPGGHLGAGFFNEVDIDRRLVALPIVQERSGMDPMSIFKRWLAQMQVLRPIPGMIQGESSKQSLEPNVDVTNLGDWFSGLTAEYPRSSQDIHDYLRQVMPDLEAIQNPRTATDSRSLTIRFSKDKNGTLKLAFEDLSDGEKCFMICALVLAANRHHGPVLCFWDEPDSHLALSEVGHFVLALRGAFRNQGQFIATSHSPEAIRHFSDENTFFLHRKSHFEPTVIRPLTELNISGDLIDALERGDVEP